MNPCCDERYLGCWALGPAARQCSSICAISAHRKFLKRQDGLAKAYYDEYTKFASEQEVSKSQHELASVKPKKSPDEESDLKTLVQLVANEHGGSVTSNASAWHAYVLRARVRERKPPPMQPLNLEILFR